MHHFVANILILCVLAFAISSLVIFISALGFMMNGKKVPLYQDKSLKIFKLIFTVSGCILIAAVLIAIN